MEHKTGYAYVKSDNDDQGIVTSFFAVMGNVDLGGDVIQPGAFKKTLKERGRKIKVLDNHRADSVQNIVGVPLEIQEVGRDELPPEILEQFPEATGAVKAVTKFLLDTPEGAGAFARIKAGAVDQWSFGYDPVDFDYVEQRGKDGKSQRVRRLKQVRLWEYSPVVWAMNPAAQTLSAKAMEAKPYDVFERGGRFFVYKIDENGQPVGDALGEHESRQAAEEQVRALYAQESDEEKGKPGQPYPWDECMADMMERYGDEDIARRVCGKIRANSTLGKTWHGTPEEFEILEAELDICPKLIKAGRVLAQRNVDRIRRALEELSAALQDAGIAVSLEFQKPAENVIPEEQDGQKSVAGPVSSGELPPTEIELKAKLLEIEQQLTQIAMEV